MQTLKTSVSKENILSRIRKGLSEDKLPMPFPEVDKDAIKDVFAKDEDSSLEETFATAFINLGGKFIFCDNEDDLAEGIVTLYDNRGWKQLLCAEKSVQELLLDHNVNFIEDADPQLSAADACITGCEMLIARTGSVMLSSRQNLGRIVSVFYPVHIVVATASQLVYDTDNGITMLKKKYDKLPSMININSGPSRTADIEKTLVVGVHGPAEVFCFLLNA
ncbi:MAG: LUD domain-containing protein [Flavipsychrobacter sp.]|nr:LUD domain-containing protein [Flavipsychrobacter sp.]